MNYLIRRTSKKEYDGPAASSVSGVAADASYAYYKQKKAGGDRNERWMDSNSSISSRQSSQSVSVMSSSIANSRHRQAQSRHVESSRKSSSSSKSRDQQSSKRMSSSTSSSRKSTDKQSRQQELASGISSRRTSNKVKNHLPAHMMSGRTSSSNGSSSSSRNGHQDRQRNSRGNGSHTQTQYQQKKQSVQIPMEHDGGILCLEPVPGSSKSNSKYRQGYDNGVTHRFLSGGADGTVKLWEVYEPPLESPDEAADSVPMTPRLVKTYRGHKGYVHSIAILGTFDPLEHKGRKKRHDAYDDESSDAEDIEDMSFSSSLDAPRRNSSEKRGFIMNRRSSNESKESQLLKKLGRRKRDLFVSASRDNTLRIWEVDNPNEHEEYFEDSSEEEEYNRSNKKDPLRKGKKLRGHGFAVNGGVLCTCAVPSLPSSSSEFHDEIEVDGMASAGQFVSGGADGVIRVWDVKSALNLEKAPKSGRYRTIQLQRLPFASETSDEDESTVGTSIRSGSSRSAAVVVTSVKCTRSQDSNSISLFASYSDGTIRRYSPVNGSHRKNHTKHAIRWSLKSIFEGHQDAVTSLTLLSSPSLMPLLAPDDEEQKSNDQAGTILISSCCQGVLRVWDALDVRLGLDQLDSSDKSEDLMREALWEIELNDDEAETDNDWNGDQPPTSINVRTLKDPVSVTSLAALDEGRVMAAGTTDGKIRLWDVSNGLYEGTYNLGTKVQVWSLAMLSEREFYRGHDEFGELQIYNTGIIIAGDNRGRLRILRKTFMHTLAEDEIEDDDEMDRIFGENSS